MAKSTLSTPFAPNTALLAAVTQLTPNPLNPRLDMDDTGLQELAASIKSVGVLQPLVITPAGVVVAGHRRLLAACLTGLEHVPVVVRDLSAQEQQSVMLVENLQRESLSPIEEARAYQRLLDSGLPRTEVARRVGVTTERIRARQVLLQFEDAVQLMFHRNDLPLAAAPLLARVPDRSRQRQLAARAAARGMTMAELERIVEHGAGVLDRPTPRDDVESHPRPTVNLDVKVLANTPGRKQTLAQMDALPAQTTIALPALQLAFKDTCCSCGMDDLPEYCATCPMVMMLGIVLRRLGSGSGSSANGHATT